MGDTLSLFKVTTRMTKKDGTFMDVVRIIDRKTEFEARDHVKSLIEMVIQQSIKMIEDDKTVNMAQKAKEIEHLTNSFQITDVCRPSKKKKFE